MTRKEKLLAKKKLGRPSTGINPTIGVRMPSKEIAAVDVWRNEQADKPSRPIAIRRLVEAALRHKFILNEKLDEALDESFPASDPVAIGHSEHAGRPKQKRKPGGGWPKGAVGLKKGKN